MAPRSRRILVGYDGSDAAKRALDTAADLTGYGSTLAVVSVQSGERSGAVAREARELLVRRHVEARYLEPTGEPADRLLEAAHELGADLVVVGRRNGSPLQLLLGSVSAKIVRRAACDVLVVR